MTSPFAPATEDLEKLLAKLRRQVVAVKAAISALNEAEEAFDEDEPIEDTSAPPAPKPRTRAAVVEPEPEPEPAEETDDEPEETPTPKRGRTAAAARKQAEPQETDDFPTRQKGALQVKVDTSDDF